MKRILVTGGRGFIGGTLAAALKDKYLVYAPTRLELDLCDSRKVQEWLRRHQVDAVVHAAVHVAMRHGSENETENILRMFFNLERCRDCYGRLIHFGSGAEFDRRLPLDMVQESDVDRAMPNDPYGFAKHIINRFTKTAGHVLNLRLFGIFGKREDWRYKFITGLCHKAVYGLPLTVRHHCFFDFMHIDDLLPVVRAAIEGRLLQKDYNVCTGKAIDLFSIAEKVQALGPPGLEVRLLSEKWMPPYTASNCRLRDDMPELRFTPLESSIADLLAYFSANKNGADFEVLKSIT